MRVINVIELTKTAPAIFIIIITCAILMVLSFICICMCCIDIKYENVGVTCFAICLLSLIGLIICGGICDEITVPTGEYQYEILIDDSVTFNEVTEKYDIIEQRGEIFVVEDKE